MSYVNAIVGEFIGVNGKTVNPQYQAPKKPWIGLTADEMEGLYQSATYMDGTDYIYMLALAEEKLKEKNHG